METRILSTDIWRDQEFRKLDDKDAKILLFILTNDQVTVLPAYKIGLDEIAFYTGTNTQRVEGLIPSLEYFGVYFIEGYFLLTNKFTRAKYSGGKTSEKRERVWSEYPERLQNIVDIEGDIDQSLLNHSPTIGDINHKPKTIKHKTETKNQKEEINFKEIADQFSKPEKEVRDVYQSILDYEKSVGKQYKDYGATIRNWIRRDNKQSNNFSKRRKGTLR